MLAEILCLLAGHPSSFFVPFPPAPSTQRTLTVSPDLESYLHPGEVSSLNSLSDLAFRYITVSKWANGIQRRGREAVLRESRKGKAKEHSNEDVVGAIPDQYLTTLAGGILKVLREYEMLVVETEARILSFDPALVQDQQGYVPLSSLVATFSSWQAPMSSLTDLINTLSHPVPSSSNWTPGTILQLIYDLAQTGNPQLETIFTSLLTGLRTVFLTHLVTFLLYGHAPTKFTPTSPAIALDEKPDPFSPKHRVYILNEDLLPSSIGKGTRESLLYVGRVAATLRREGRELPKSMVNDLREEIQGVQGLEDGGGLDQAISRARAEVGEWLWKHILTGSQVIDALETFGNYFLTRRADYAVSLIREIHRLRLDKLITSNPHSSSSVIREQDLNLAILRASVGTSGENDAGIDRLRFRLEKGPVRPIMPSLTASQRKRSEENPFKDQSSVRYLFSSSLLGSPLVLDTTVSWPLDLFMTPPARAAYSDIHAYLFAIRDTHQRVLDCWTSLSASQRRRRKWTGTTEGGTADEIVSRRKLARSAWGTIRAMLFFLDELHSHFMTDIIEVQHRRLLNQLEEADIPRSNSVPGSLRSSTKFSSPQSRFRSATLPEDRPESPGSFDAQTFKSRAPPTPSKRQIFYLDFLTLRQMHARHLAFLREGLLLADRDLAVTVRDVLEICNRFTGLVERWGGDVLPELLVEGSSGEDVGQLVSERGWTVNETKERLHELLSDFFRSLLESQNPTSSTTNGDSTIAGAGGGTSISRTARATQMIHSTRIISRQVSFATKNSGMGGVGPGGRSGGGGRSKADIEKDEKDMEAEALMGRHIEQLLLRLDFNGVLTAWLSDENEITHQGVLAEGGL